MGWRWAGQRVAGAGMGVNQGFQVIIGDDGARVQAAMPGPASDGLRRSVAVQAHGCDKRCTPKHRRGQDRAPARGRPAGLRPCPMTRGTGRVHGRWRARDGPGIRPLAVCRPEGLRQIRTWRAGMPCHWLPPLRAQGQSKQWPVWMRPPCWLRLSMPEPTALRGVPTCPRRWRRERLSSCAGLA